MAAEGLPELADRRRPRSYWAEDIGRVRYHECFAFNPLGKRYDLVSFDISNQIYVRSCLAGTLLHPWFRCPHAA